MFNTPGQVFMIIAPSGAGKSSLVNALLQEDPSIKLSISTTTRAPRPGEVDGREYHFVTQEDFQSCLNDNGFLEWAEVHGNFYGTPLSWIKDQVTAGQDILLEIDWQGAQQVRQRYPGVIDIFILPPSIQALEERLYKRGQDSQDVIARRLLAAGSEISHASECEYVIINETFQDALTELKLIIAAARLRFVAQYARHRDFFSELGITQHT